MTVRGLDSSLLLPTSFLFTELYYITYMSIQVNYPLLIRDYQEKYLGGYMYMYS